jgi:hypothetical protein
VTDERLGAPTTEALTFSLHARAKADAVPPGLGKERHDSPR